MTTTISQNLITPGSNIIYQIDEVTSDLTTIDMSGFSLEAGGYFEIDFWIPNTSGSTSSYYLTVNGTHTLSAYQAQVFEANGVSVVGAHNSSPAIALSQTAKNCVGHGRITHAPNGAYYVNTDVITNVSNTPDHLMYRVWKDNPLVAPITTLRLTSSIAGAIGIGATFRIINPLGS